MNFLLQRLKSTFIYFYILGIRIFDHGWRKIFGLPLYSKSRITPNLFLGGQYSTRGLKRLKRMGVTGIINMRESPIKKKGYEKDFSFLHIPTKDQEAPSLKALQKGIKFITKEFNNKGTVYVHCRYGEGRGPTMIIAYLISTGLTFTDSVTLVKKVRPFIQLTKPQIAVLLFLEQHVAAI